MRIKKKTNFLDFYIAANKIKNKIMFINYKNILYAKINLTSKKLTQIFTQTYKNPNLCFKLRFTDKMTRK